MLVKGTGSWCMLVEHMYVKENDYARFYNPRYHRYIQTHYSTLLDVKF